MPASPRVCFPPRLCEEAAAELPRRSHSEIWAFKFDRFAEQRSRNRGKRDCPQPPRSVAKMRENWGKLWLGGIPLNEEVDRMEGDKQFALQICCFATAP